MVAAQRPRLRAWLQAAALLVAPLVGQPHQLQPRGSGGCSSARLGGGNTAAVKPSPQAAVTQRISAMTQGKAAARAKAPAKTAAAAHTPPLAVPKYDVNKDVQWEGAMKEKVSKLADSDMTFIDLFAREGLDRHRQGFGQFVCS
jgi:hypothetical protein